VLIYFNFEDTPVPPGNFDPESDDVPPLGDNPGGGVQHQTLQDDLTVTGTVAGTLLNRTALDSDTANPGQAMGMRTTPVDNGKWIQFPVDATAFSSMNLSFAINTQGNGFNNVAFSYSFDGTNFTPVGSVFVPAGGGFQTFSFAVPSAVNGQANVILRLTFNGGTSNGNNLQTVIDNIQLTGVSSLSAPTTRQTRSRGTRK
jgi:hypothetical protein